MPAMTMMAGPPSPTSVPCRSRTQKSRKCFRWARRTGAERRHSSGCPSRRVGWFGGGCRQRFRSSRDDPRTLQSSSQERFRRADLIIAKRQRNYESLSSDTAPIFFLLKVKCPVIARWEISWCDARPIAPGSPLPEWRRLAGPLLIGRTDGTGNRPDSDQQATPPEGPGDYDDSRESFTDCSPSGSTTARRHSRTEFSKASPSHLPRSVTLIGRSTIRPSSSSTRR